ncbi:hypothetical protein A33Q_0165 [Indibacter alkaliphilus LW1]|uniref:Uncharacterized protein n=1 Tax=Indibacter alkaliphilus (strain CCUG 57479 / KCTC 22604 / LW1) TaxID=1189612 RepID=S2ED31_INDAL|nr:hypothetical protein [Indibacter alkaliphilus]EPA00294.1 hypothetical protein A33Q_0165 [Indibacter alkaliphilus LW1]
MEFVDKREFGRVLLLLVSFFIIAFSAGCLEVDETGEYYLSLSDIGELTEQDSISLIGTRWRLLGFGEEGSNRIRVAEPRDTDSQLWLEFHEDGTIEGRSSNNLLSRKFHNFSNNEFELLEFYVLSYALESGDGFYMTSSLENADMGNVETKGLKVYYTENEQRLFMLFRPLMP